ncbi:MAG: DUF5131 family protein [Bacteroides xylanisolvens]
MEKSKIEWTDTTWNPVTGCTKLSAGCKNCYAETMSRRLKAMNVNKYKNGFNVSLHDNVLLEPYKWKSPHKVFVNSMSDLFHEEVPFDFVDKIFNVIQETPQHQYQVLTKRANRMQEYFSNKSLPNNVWIGVTVEDANCKERIDFLNKIKATIKFISFEPLLGDLGKLDLSCIDWVIVGGESGSKARPMKEEWVSNILIQAKKKKIPFFFKQWGTWSVDGIKRSKKANGCMLLGKTYKEFPL